MSVANVVEQLYEVDVDVVKVGERFRKDMGDVESLCESIERQGLLQPILIDEERNLICGERRLIAFRQLGLSRIPCRVVDLPDLLQAERDENEVRKEFAWSEKVAIGRALEERERAKAKAREQFGKRIDPKENFPEGTGQSRDAVGKALGVSGKTYEKAKKVIEAAEANPEKFQEIVDKMDLGPTEGGISVHAAFVAVENTKTIDETKARILSVNPPEGTYRCVVIDPPWPMKKIAREVRPNQAEDLDYPTMTLEEIGALPVPSLLDKEGCHVYLWVTQKYLPAGLALFEEWGINYQCLLTWVKPVGFTPYSWMYNTEHVLFGRVGNLGLLKLGRKLSFEAPTEGHSVKPEKFYELVTECSPGPRLEMFSRKERDGFTAWGSEV